MDDQASGKDERRIIAAGLHRLRSCAPPRLSNGHGFTGEKRFIHLQFMRGKKLRVCRNTITFRHDDDITRHDFAARDAALHAVANDERSGACKVAQALEDTFRLQVLIDDDSEIDERQDRK